MGWGRQTLTPAPETSLRKVPDRGGLVAEWTGLEPATPSVTG
jgi:hypothetical protein